MSEIQTQVRANISLVQNKLMKPNVGKVIVECRAVNEVEVQEMNIPQRIKIEENFDQKATCKYEPSLYMAQVTQVWSHLDTVPLNSEQETVQVSEIHLDEREKYSTMYVMQEDEKVNFEEIKLVSGYILVCFSQFLSVFPRGKKFIGIRLS